MSIRSKYILAIALLASSFLLVFFLFRNSDVASATGTGKVIILTLITLLAFLSSRVSYLIFEFSDKVKKIFPLLLMIIGITLGSIFSGALVIYFGFRNFGF